LKENNAPLPTLTLAFPLKQALCCPGYCHNLLPASKEVSEDIYRPLIQMLQGIFSGKEKKKKMLQIVYNELVVSCGFWGETVEENVYYLLSTTALAHE